MCVSSDPFTIIIMCLVKQHRHLWFCIKFSPCCFEYSDDVPPCGPSSYTIQHCFSPVSYIIDLSNHNVLEHLSSHYMTIEIMFVSILKLHVILYFYQPFPKLSLLLQGVHNIHLRDHSECCDKHSTEKQIGLVCINKNLCHDAWCKVVRGADVE